MITRYFKSNLFFVVIAFAITTQFWAQSKKVNPNSDIKIKSTVQVYTTGQNADFRLSKTEVTFQKAKHPIESEIYVFVNPNKKHQIFMGIGGAITDASAEVFAKLSVDKQKEIIDAYFSAEDGIGYTLLRTNINSCDFSSESYNYVSNSDKNLSSFSISHDLEFKVPMLKRAMKQIGKSAKLYASPWSPPAFMKTNNNMLLGGSLKPEYYNSWALYYTKFIKAYEKIGIPIWGISIQNEPMATQRWESCIYEAEQERDFLKNHLGPIMKKENLGNKKIIVWDHNRDLMSQRAEVIFADKEASKYAWGIGFHWYENWSGGDMMFDNVQKVNLDYPTKNIIFTEGCAEKFDASKYQNWANGVKYGKSMINDFNNGTVAWTDWNILLDQNGGPNHVGNFCFAPVHADLASNTIIYTPSYYVIGHFSKFIKQNARRLSSSVSRSQLLTTSFMNANGKCVTIVLNTSEKTVSYNLQIQKKNAQVVIPANAIQTLVY